MVDIRVGEEIIGHIASEVGNVVGPLRCSGKPAYFADMLASKLTVSIDIALDSVGITSPTPVGTDGHATTRSWAVIIGALGTSSRGVKSPEIVQDGVFSGRVVSILRAQRGHGCNSGWGQVGSVIGHSSR